jgi:hypothetical protein
MGGAGGSSLPGFEPGDPAIAAELEPIRGSGLSGVVLSLTPSGQFWMDDAAFEKTQADIDKWDEIIARYPQHLLPVRTGADLRALAEKGVVVGIIFWTYLRTDTQPMAIDVTRHIEHAVKVCGEDHVGIGTDTDIAAIERTAVFEKENRDWVANAVVDGVFERGRPPDLYTFIPDLNRADRFDTLAALLSKRGHSDARIAKILGGNLARVMGAVWP